MEEHIKVVLGLSCLNHVCKQALQQRRSVNMPGYYLLQRLQHLTVSLFVRSKKPQKKASFITGKAEGNFVSSCTFIICLELYKPLIAPSCTRGAVGPGGLLDLLCDGDMVPPWGRVMSVSRGQAALAVLSRSGVSTMMKWWSAAPEDKPAGCWACWQALCPLPSTTMLTGCELG